MFRHQHTPAQPQEKDETLIKLRFQRDNIIKNIETASKKVEVKKVSIATGKPACYYQNRVACGFTLLSLPLAYYEKEKANFEHQKLELDARIHQHMETKNQTPVAAPRKGM